MAKATLMPTVAMRERSGNWWEQLKNAPEVNAKQKIIQTITFKLGSFDDDNRTFRAVASTSIVDRAGDVIEQDGWDLANFIANPVIPWCHDYWQLPVGRAVEIGVSDGALQFTYQAPPKGLYEFADTVWDMYRNQFMFAFSVGFIPKKADGAPMDWDDYGEDGTEYEGAELLEISAVVVPANPQALALAHKSGIVNVKAAETLMQKTTLAMKHLEESLQADQEELEAAAVTEQITFNALEEAVERAVEKAMSKLQEEQLKAKAAISSDLSTAPKDTSWDSGAAIKAIKSWASDSSGDIDFSKYKKCFMWVDSSGGDKQGDYKLPYADIVGGEPKAVWNAVKAIMAVLNGGRGGVDIPTADRSGVYTQVKKYYSKFDEDAPALKAMDLTETTDIGNNETMNTSSNSENEVETEVETKDLGEGSDGGGNLTPRPTAQDDEVKAPKKPTKATKSGYAMVESLHDTADTLKAHSDALNDHATTMKAHASLVASKVDAIHKAADSLQDLLNHQGDETSNKDEPEPVKEPGGAEDEGTEKGETTHESDGMSKSTPEPKTKDVAEAPVETEPETEAPEPEVPAEPGPQEPVAKAEVEEGEVVTPVEETTPQEGNVAGNEEVVDDSGEVKSEEAVPTDGADHEDEDSAEEELYDPDNLTPDQVEKILALINAEQKDQKDEN